jgi:hypothetical protein
MNRICSLAGAVLGVSLFALAGCGEHPCTLGVGEPQWCTANPGDAFDNPFCGEVCDVCEYDRAERRAAACAAKCREVVGIDTLTCEELDPLVEIEYRECVRTSDYPGCGDPNATPN